MPNIKISALEIATFPLDDPNTLFEVTTIEAGEEVSRRISLEDIAGATGLDASFLTLSTNAQLPNERVLTEGAGISFVDTGPNGTLTISAAGISFPLLAPDGSAAAPSYSFASDSDNGMFLTASNQLSFASGGVEAGRFNQGFGINQFALIESGSSTVPDLTSLTDFDTGFSWTGVNTMRWIGGGTRAWNFSTARFFSQFSNGPSLENTVAEADVPTVLPDHSDGNTGLGATGSDVMTFVAGGIEAARVSELGGLTQFLLPQVNDQVTPTLAFGDGGDGIYDAADGVMALALNGVAHWQWTDGTDSYTGIIVGAAAMRNVTTSDVVPTLCPNRNNLISGIGQNALNEVSLIGNSVELARAVSAASGGLLANNTLTGGGIERVLTVSDAFAGVPDPLLLSDGSAAAPSYSFTSDTDIGMFRVGADILGFSARATEMLQVVGALGANQVIVAPGAIQNNQSAPDLGFGDGNTGIMQTVEDTLAIIAGGNQAVRYEEAAAGIIQSNANNTGLTASVTQTQGGGLALISSYNEIAVVANSGDALTAFDVFEGHRLIIVNNGANDLQLFPSVGDDIGAGVDTAITIAAGAIGIFLGRDSIDWDTLYNAAPTPAGGAGVVAGDTDGEMLIWDVGNNQYEPVSDSVMQFNPASPPTSPLGRFNLLGSSTTDVRKSMIHVRVGASVSTVWSTSEEGGTPSGFYSRSSLNGSPLEHDWGYWAPGTLTGTPIFHITEDLEFVHEQSAFFEERAAALASVAGRGQVWVRSDVPNVLMYTDDAGTDFVLNAGGGGGSLPLGTVTNAGLKWDGAANWIEETQIQLMGGANGLRVTDLTGADYIEMGHDGSNARVRVNNAGTSDVIFGGGGAGPSNSWRFEQKVRVPDGSAAVPGLAFFTGGTDGFYRAAGPAVGTVVGGVEHFRVSNAVVAAYSDDFRLNPNFGADMVRFIVNGPSHLNDFEIELTSLVDIHVTGSTGERFVLEEFNLAMVEKAAAPADVAGVGQFWVRDDVPNTPMFTDDAGTDFVLNAGGGLDNDACQARRTTGYILTGAFVDITMDTTDIETDSAVIDHDLGGNDDNIIFGAAGTYEVTVDMEAVSNETSGDPIIDMGVRVRLNDAGTGVAGSHCNPYVFRDGSVGGDDGNFRIHLSNTFVITVSATDFITLQLDQTDLSGSGEFEVFNICVKARRLL